MQNKLFIYNTLSREKQLFEPIHPPHVGMYVCGPTVYGDAHIGHARAAVTFDLVFRYLKYLGYKVRYVRNITDVGHLEHDADEGEDRIAKKARLEKLEPMEVVQYYTTRYHLNMNQLNVLPPSIEPHASGHIIEQQQLVEKIIEKGYGYVVNGSVYFDVEKYNQSYDYGKLSGRKIEDLLSYTRTLKGKDEKKNSFDFALWKKAGPEHIMQWPSKWSDGFPGWHLECSTMGIKYLGEKFDIHGGGLDLLFPHHECEIAQTKAALGKEAVKYWMHNNMITISEQKMGKSLSNFVTLNELFSGKHELLKKAYSPMTARFFILQAHYRSTLAFSIKAFQSSEKGLQRIFNGLNTLNKITPSESSSIDMQSLKENCFKAMNDDLNTPILISFLFDGIKMINSIYDGNEKINTTDLEQMKKLYNDFIYKILGLKEEEDISSDDKMVGNLVNMILKLRQDAKTIKDFNTADKIRSELNKLGIEIKDKKDGIEWNKK